MNKIETMAQRLASHLPLPEADPLDFSAPLLRLQNKPANPLGQRVLWVLLAFLVALLLWAIFGQLDIVAVAEGKLIPQSYVKIVQPAEAGIVKQILAACRTFGLLPTGYAIIMPFEATEGRHVPLHRHRP